MKRLYIAIFLLILTLFLSALEYALVSESCNDFSDILDETEVYFSNKEFSSAEESIKNAQDFWDKRVKLLNSLVDHGDTKKITESISQLLDFIKQEDSTQFSTVYKQTKRQLLSLKESELPSFYNIL